MERNLTAIAVVIAAAIASPAKAQTIELKVSHFLPANHTFQKAMMAWGEELDKASNGRLKLGIYPAGQPSRFSTKLMVDARAVHL